MLRLFRTTRELTVAFCHRRARMCDVACRADAARERTLANALSFEVRF